MRILLCFKNPGEFSFRIICSIMFILFGSELYPKTKVLEGMQGVSVCTLVSAKALSC